MAHTKIRKEFKKRFLAQCDYLVSSGQVKSMSELSRQITGHRQSIAQVKFVDTANIPVDWVIEMKNRFITVDLENLLMGLSEPQLEPMTMLSQLKNKILGTITSYEIAITNQ